MSKNVCEFYERKLLNRGYTAIHQFTHINNSFFVQYFLYVQGIKI